MIGRNTRRQLAGALVADGAVHSPWLRCAFEDTPREVFVPRFYRSESGREVLVEGTDRQQHDEWLRGVYTDEALTVQLTPAPDLANGAGAPTSSSSMQTVMVGMLEALDLQPGHRVLEIGTGTGYNTALLCYRVGALPAPGQRHRDVRSLHRRQLVHRRASPGQRRIVSRGAGRPTSADPPDE